MEILFGKCQASWTEREGSKESKAPMQERIHIHVFSSLHHTLFSALGR